MTTPAHYKRGYCAGAGVAPVPYWMIEKIIDGRAYWWMPDHSGATHWEDPCRWTTDASKARHYECAADAEYVIGHQMPGCFVTEHLDCPNPGSELTAATAPRTGADGRGEVL